MFEDAIQADRNDIRAIGTPLQWVHLPNSPKKQTLRIRRPA